MKGVQIKSGSWWRYIGPGEGKNQKHKVVWVEPHQVVTWSEMGNNMAGGWSWLGSQDDFYKHFVTIQ